MFDVLGIIGLFAAGKQIIKEKTEKEIPASYWNNKDLIHKDKMNPDVSPQQLMKNLKVENTIVLLLFQRSMSSLSR